MGWFETAGAVMGFLGGVTGVAGLRQAQRSNHTADQALTESRMGFVRGEQHERLRLLRTDLVPQAMELVDAIAQHVDLDLSGEWIRTTAPSLAAAIEQIVGPPVVDPELDEGLKALKTEAATRVATGRTLAEGLNEYARLIDVTSNAERSAHEAYAAAETGRQAGFAGSLDPSAARANARSWAMNLGRVQDDVRGRLSAVRGALEVVAERLRFLETSGLGVIPTPASEST